MTCPQCFYANVNTNGDCPRCHGQGLKALTYSRKSKTKRRAPISTPINRTPSNSNSSNSSPSDNSQLNLPTNNIQPSLPMANQGMANNGHIPRPVVPGRAGGVNNGPSHPAVPRQPVAQPVVPQPLIPQPVVSQQPLPRPVSQSQPSLPQPPLQSPPLQQSLAQQPASVPFCPCPVCSNLEVQKVSAIVRAGTWGETTSWNQQTQLEAQTSGASFGVMYGDKQSYPMGTVSGSRSHGQASTSGQGASSGATTLAQFLAAPLRPAQPVRQGMTESVLQFFWGVPFFLTLGWLAGIVVLWVAFPLSLLCLLVLFGAWQTNRDTYEKAKADHPTLERLWSARYSRWERLYYCSRCDHVFLPENRRFAPIAQMYVLLDSDS